MAKAIIYLTLLVTFVGLASAYNEGDACTAPDPSYYGYYAPHPVYCYRYLQCTHGRFISRNCSPGLHWNPYEGFNGACDFPANANCTGLTTQRTTTTEGTTTAPTTTVPTTTTTYYPTTEEYETTEHDTTYTDSY